MKTVTVRMDDTTYELLRERAYVERTSINKWIVSELERELIATTA